MKKLILLFCILVGLNSCKKEENKSSSTGTPPTHASTTTTYYLTSTRQYDEADSIVLNTSSSTISVPVISFYPDTLNTSFFNHVLNVLPLRVSGSFTTHADSTATLFFNEYNLSTSTEVHPYITCTYHQ